MKTRISRALFAAIFAIAGRAAARLTDCGRGGRGIRVSLFAVGVAVFAVLFAAVPQAAQAQITVDLQVQCVGQAYKATIGGGTCDRNGNAIGFHLREGDQFEVEVRVTGGTIPAGGSISAIVVPPSTDITTTGTSGTINARTGIRFSLSPSQTSHKMTWTVTDDATNEAGESLDFRLYNNAYSSNSLGATTVTVAGGATGRLRTVVIQESDRHVLMPQVRTGANAPAEGPTFLTFDIVLAAGTTSPGSVLQNVHWYVTFDAADTNPASEADFVVGSGAGQIRDLGSRTNNSCNGLRGSPVAGAGNAQVQSTVATTPTSNNIARLSINDDSLIEQSETFTLHLCGPTTDSGISYGSAAATITDNDGVTFNVVQGINTNNNFGVVEGASASNRNIRIQYVAQAGGTRQLGSLTVINATIVGETPSGLNVATSGYPQGITSERAASATDDFASATFACSIPGTTTHNAIVTCALPEITDDTLSERVEHFSVQLSAYTDGDTTDGDDSTPSGVQYGSKFYHFIRASDVITMNIAAANYEGTEGGSAVDVTVEFSAAAGTTIPSGLTEFRLLFDDGATTYRTETPGVGDAQLIGATPIWARAADMRSYTFSVPANTVPSADTNAEADEVQTWRLRGTVAGVGFAITGGDSGNDGTFTITYKDDDPASWTVRARGSGIQNEDVNENAAAIASPTTADTGSNHANTMYFRFTNYEGLDPRGEVTLTYCLAGTATGATQAAITAGTAGAYDYTYPTGYDPTGTSAVHSGFMGSCTGRGSFTIAAGADETHRLGIALNNDNLNEGDETITATVINVTEAGYTTRLENPAAVYAATRTIKDNDAISISIAVAGTDADGTTNGHQVVEGTDATFTVTLGGAAGGSASAVTVAYTVGGMVEAADYTDSGGGSLTIPANTTSGTITIAVAADSDTDATEDLTVTIAETGHSAAGTIARSSTNSEQSATAIVTNRAFQHTLSLVRLDGAGTSAQTISSPQSALAENNGAEYFMVVQPGISDPAFAADQTITWTVTHADTNGTNADDFTGATTGTLTFPTSGCTAAVASCRFTVTIADDTVDEPGSEGFSVVLSVADDTVDGGIDVGSGSGALTIADNDDFTIDIRTASTSVSEGGFAVVSLTPTVSAARQVTMDYDHLSSTAESGLTLTSSSADVDATLPTTGGAAGGDFGALRTGSAGTMDGTTAGHTVTFPADSTAAQYLLIPITADNLNEAAETFQLTTFTVGFSGQYSGGFVLPVGSGMDDRGAGLTFTIAASNAMTASVAAAAETYNEGQTARFTVTLAGATSGSAAAVTVPYTVTTTGAGYTITNLAADTDLTAGTGELTGSLTIAASQTTGHIDITLPVSGTLGTTDPDQMLTLTLDGDDSTTDATDEGPTTATGGGAVTRTTTADDQAGTVTINFVDAARTLTVTGPATIAEGDTDSESTNYTITLTGDTFPAATTVTWTVANDDTVNADFSAASDRSGTVEFSTTDTSKTFTLTVAGDNINEAREEFTVNATAVSPANPTGGVAYGTAARTAIIDNDPVEITIARHSSCTSPIAESAATRTCRFDITIGGGTRPAGAPGVFVFYQLGGTGITAADISSPNNPLGVKNNLIAQNQSSAMFTVTIANDDLNEAAETLTLTGAAVGPTGTRFQGGTVAGGELRYASASANAASVGITDDDAISVSIANRGTDADTDSATTFEVEEGGNAVFRVTIDHASASNVMVPFTVTGLEAADVTGGLSAIPTSPLTITAGQTHADITIPLAADTDTGADEDSETLTVTLGATGYSAAGSIARSTTSSEQSAAQNIIPVGAVRTLTVTARPDAAHPEGDSNATHGFRMTLTGMAYPQNTIVGWRIIHGTTADADFSGGTTGTVTFNTTDGDASFKDFMVTIVGDNINEANETFTVQANLADATLHGGTDYGDPASLTITDDDDIQLSFRAAGQTATRQPTVSEDETAADTPRTIVLTVDLGATASRNVDVSFTGRFPEGVAATSRADDVAATGGAMGGTGVDAYISARQHPGSGGRDGVITIPSGSRMSTITVAIVDDDLNEAPETYTLSAGVSAGAHRNVTIASGAPTVSLGTGVTLAAAIFTITDDDPITYSIARRSGDSGNARELGQAHFTITMTGATDGSAAAVTIPYTVSSGTYAIPDGMVTVPAETTSHDFALDLPGDSSRNTGTQAVTVTLGASPTIASGGGSATRGTPNNAQVTVDFVSSARTLSVTIASTTITENDAAGGQASANITIAMGASDNTFSAAATTINWEVVHGTTTAADFVASSDLSGSVIFDSDDRSTDTFTIDIAGDNLNEGNETFTIRASVADPSADGGTAPGVSAAVTITDDDPIVLGITTSTGPTEGGNFNLTFNFGALASRAITLNYDLIRTTTTTDVDAVLTGQGADLADADNGSVTLATTATQVTIDPRITITNDTLNESAETFVLRFTPADITGEHGTAAFAAATLSRSDCNTARCEITYTIAASDPATVSIARRSGDSGDASEGGQARYTVTLSTASAAVVTVPYTFSATGSPAYDVSGLASSVDIPAGMTTANFSVTLPNSNDLGTANNPGHMLTVTIPAPAPSATPPVDGVTVASGGGTVSRHGSNNAVTVPIAFINAAHSFTLTSPATTITEGDSDVRQMYTITRTGPSITGTLSIRWTVAIESGQTAAAADFNGNALPTGTVDFTGSQTTRTFPVVIEGDNLNEADETFTINFANATSTSVTNSNNGVAEPSSQAVTITDDDPIAVTVTATTNVQEGGNAVVNVNLGAIPTRAIRITYSSQAAATSATDDVDATHAGGANDDLGTISNGAAIDIAANTNPPVGSMTIPVTDDSLNESAETFQISTFASSITGEYGTATVGGGASVNTVFTIAASDPIRYSIARHTGDSADPTDEGQQARFTVSITGATSGSAGQIQIPYTVTGSGSYNVASGERTGMVTFAANSAADQTITLTLPTDGSLGTSNPDQTLTVQLGATPTVATGGGAVTRSGNGRAQVRVNFIDSARTLTVTGPATHAEGNTNSDTTDYTITLRGMAFSTDTTVTWAVQADGMAGRAGSSDFVETSDLTGTVTFAMTEGNGTTKMFSITVVGDTINEADETFTVQVSVAAPMGDGGTAYGSPVTTTIEDNDDLSVGVAFADTTVAEDASTSFTITLNGARSGDVTVPFTLSGLDSGEYSIDAQTSPPPANTAALTASGASGSVVFESADSNTFTVNISLNDDNLNEATEMLTVTGGTLTAAGTIAYTTANNGVHSVSITDTDAISVSIARHADTMATVEEGRTAQFTVTLENAAGTAITSAGPITVAYDATWDDATFTAGMLRIGREMPANTVSGDITIAAGQMTGQIAVQIRHVEALDDTVNMSPDEDFTVELGMITTGDGAGTASEHATENEVTITVDWIDAAHTIEVADVTVNEGAASITVTRSATDPLVQPVDIMWAVTTSGTGATHATAADFSGGLPSGSVRFAGSQEEATIRLPIIDDNLAEMAETFTLTLSENIDDAVQQANSFVAADDSATITITDDDNISIRIGGQRRVSEERSVTFPVTLTATPTAQLTVNWAVDGAGSGTCTDGTETVAAVPGDFAASAGGAALTAFTSLTDQTLTFASGVTSQTITLHTSAGAESTSAADAANANGNWDQSCDREFTITLSMVSGGGGTMTPTAPAAVTITISEDNPEAIAELNEAVLPEVARAVATNQVAAIAERVGAAGGVAASVPSFNLGGQSTAAGMTAQNLRDWAKDGDLDTKELLRDMDFVMPLNAAGGLLGENRMALWGGSDYRDFKGEGDSANKPKWDGEMFSLHVGADARISERLLVGVMLSHSDAESEYQYNDNGRDTRGDYDLEMTGFSPYLSWDLGGDSAWLSLGYGQGDLTIDPDEAGRDTMESDVDMTSFGAGGARLLRASDAHELRLKGDAFVAQIDVDGDADNENLNAIEVDANRLRVLVESRHKFALASGAQFTPLVDLGARYDGGDGSTGSGIEVGGGVHYSDAALGLTAEARARVLLGHSGDQEEWGVGGVVRMDPGADGQGLALSLAPAYGDDTADAQGMWDNGVAGVGSAAAGSSAADREATLAAEVAYGMPAAFIWRDSAGVFSGGGGMLTPYSAMKFGDKNDYRLGLRWKAPKIGLDLSARRLDTDNRLTLEGKLRF